MILEANNADELWRKAAADSKDATNLFMSPVPDREKVFTILRKLRSSTAAMQALERLLISGPPKVG